MDTRRLVSQIANVLTKMLTCLAVVLAAAQSTASAHAILLDSEPVARATIQPGDTVFTLHYNSRLDHARSRLTLIGPDQMPTQLPIDPVSQPDQLATSLHAVPGAWTIRWQVLALDGHITRGDLPFQVTAGP